MTINNLECKLQFPISKEFSEDLGVRGNYKKGIENVSSSLVWWLVQPFNPSAREAEAGGSL